MKTAIFPGSFDPFTLGHKIVVDKGLELFDKIVVAVGVNNQKNGMLTPEMRTRLIADIYAEEPRVEVMIYNGLTIDFGKKIGAQFILRGMRNSVDFEFERNMMQVNQTIHPDITTVLLFTPPEYVQISSSVVRELYTFGGDISKFMPAGIELAKYL